MQFSFDLWALRAFVSLLMTIPITWYLIRIRPKPATHRSLTSFFLLVDLQLVVSLIGHGLALWANSIWVVEQSIALVAQIFIVRIAYQIPEEKRTLESTATLVWMIFIAAISIGFSFYYVAKLLFMKQPVEVHPFFWCLLPLSSVSSIIVNFRRMAQLQDATPIGTSWYSTFMRPTNKYAAAQRNFGLASMSVWIQIMALIFEDTPFELILPSQSYIFIGSLLWTIIIIHAYSGISPAPTTFLFRLTALSLAALLIVFGIPATEQLKDKFQAIKNEYALQANFLKAQASSGEIAIIPDEVKYLVRYPGDIDKQSRNLELLFERENLPHFELEKLTNQISDSPTNAELFTGESELFPLSRNMQFPAGSEGDFLSYLYLDNGKIYEVGFDHPIRSQTSHNLVLLLFYRILFGAIVMTIVLSYFYRWSLAAPFASLLTGVRRINDGDLSTKVPIHADDEIGFLTTSFNEMTQRLQTLTNELEQKVEERTMSLAREIDIHKLTQEALYIEKERAEMASQAKSVFLANMSHELRTPLNAILGYSQVLKGEGGGSRSAEIIHASGKHLLVLVNDILDFARIDTGKVQLNPTPTKLAPLLRTVGEMMRLQAEGKGLLFECRGSADVFVIIDSKRLRQILINLVSNAIKFTASGSVKVTVNATPSESQLDYYNLSFQISDTGIGIAAEDLPNIFEPFFQADNIPGAKEGTGLGLSISNFLVTMMGGTLSVDSQPGHGTTFSFNLLTRQVGDVPASDAIAFLHSSNLLPPDLPGTPDESVSFSGIDGEMVSTLPPYKTLESLLDSSKQGNIMEVATSAQQLSAEMGETLFTKTLNQYVGRFQFEKLTTWLEDCIQESEQTPNHVEQYPSNDPSG